MSEMILTNARIVLDDAVIEGSLQVRAGAIHSFDVGTSAAAGAIDLDGDYLLPGLVDIHTDHLEKHVYPRPHVRWDVRRAVLAHDAQIIGGGVTTVFDSLCVGGTEKNPERRTILEPMVEALRQTGDAGLLRAEHFVHLRCEITDADAPALARANAGKEIVRLVSVMEHVPGHRQSRDMGHYIGRRMAASGQTRDQVEAEIQELMERLKSEGTNVRAEIVAIAHAHQLPLLSHDDATPEQVLIAYDEGIRIAEFPVSLEAARRAKALSMHAVVGAPNFLRGGSQSGNVAVKALLAEGLADIFASDYVPRSMLDAAFALAENPDLSHDLASAIRMVTSAPARVARLEDRGEILPALKADLVQVRLVDGLPVVQAVWRSGRRVN